MDVRWVKVARCGAVLTLSFRLSRTFASRPERWYMRASSVTRRLLATAVVRDWEWWQLPWLLRWYVGAVPVAARADLGLAAANTSWHPARSGEVLPAARLRPDLGGGHPPDRLRPGGCLVGDFLTVWVLPVAILLPPFYAIVTPIPLLALTQWRIHRGVVHRRVFTAAAIGLAYGAAALAFRAFPVLRRPPWHRQARPHLDRRGRSGRDRGRTRTTGPGRSSRSRSLTRRCFRLRDIDTEPRDPARPTSPSSTSPS